MSVENKIRQFVLNDYLFTDDQAALDNNDSFLEKGIVDSTGILEIIYFIEDECGFTVDDDEMIPENLDSVSNIVAFVNNKST